MAVAITGLGIVTPFGIGAPCFFRAAMEGRGPVPLDIDEVRREFRGRLSRLNDETMILLLAVHHALVDGGLTPPVDLGGLGVAVSTQDAGLQAYTALYLRDADGHRVSPVLGPQTGVTAPAAQVSIDLKAGGPNATFPTGPVAGIEALTWAIDALESGAATAMLTCGVDLPPEAIASRQRSDARGPRPFDFRRFGPVPAGAAVAILLEDEWAVRQRQVCPPYIRVEATATAFSPFGSLVDACSRALQNAIGQTPWDCGRIGGCIAGANGSVAGDACEAFTLHDELKRGTAVAAIKGTSGEVDGAGALLQVAAATLSLRCGTLPPTTGLVRLDPSLPPLKVSSRPAPIDVKRPLIVHAFDPEDAAGAVIVRTEEREP